MPKLSVAKAGKNSAKPKKKKVPKAKKKPEWDVSS